MKSFAERRAHASVLWSVLREDGAIQVVVIPALIATVAFVASIPLAPDIDSGTDHGRFSNLFGTSAQVTATLLVALALETRELPPWRSNTRLLVAIVTLAYVGAGLIASVIALNPTLSSCAYAGLFAVSMGAGAGALTSIVAIAYLIIADRRRQDRDELTTQPPFERSDEETGSE